MRYAVLSALLPLFLLATPASAATKSQKMETCKVGADADHLEGTARDDFMKKCMGAGNYEPQARKDAMKTAPNKTAAKKRAAKPMAAPAATTQPKQ
jgi:hypothetical protein